MNYSVKVVNIIIPDLVKDKIDNHTKIKKRLMAMESRHSLNPTLSKKIYLIIYYLFLVILIGILCCLNYVTRLVFKTNVIIPVFGPVIPLRLLEGGIYMTLENSFYY